jgi:pyrimidine deaminase RibD-like protein
MASSQRIDFDKAREKAHQCLNFAWQLYGNRLAAKAGLTVPALMAYHDTVEAVEELCEIAAEVITSELLDALCKASAMDRPPVEYRLGNMTCATAHGLAFKFLAVLWEELQYPHQRGVVNLANEQLTGANLVEDGFRELEQKTDAELHSRGLLCNAVMDMEISLADVEALRAGIDREWGSARAKAKAKQRMTANPEHEIDLQRKFMEMAVEEACKCKPKDERVHPRVGAVVVKDGIVLATAYRSELAEGDHAEYTALEKKMHDKTIAGATVYTTLEPCTARSPSKVPCTDRLIQRRVKRVVIGMPDPNRTVYGEGWAKLREAGIDTANFDEDLKAEIEEMNREFINQHKNANDSALSAGKRSGLQTLYKWIYCFIKWLWP